MYVALLLLQVHKSATLSTSPRCISMARLNFQAVPIVQVGTHDDSNKCPAGRHLTHDDDDDDDVNNSSSSNNNNNNNDDDDDDKNNSSSSSSNSNNNNNNNSNINNT